MNKNKPVKNSFPHLKKNFLSKIIKSFYLFKTSNEHKEESLNIAKNPIRIGILSTIFLLGSFVIWGAVFKINSTVISSGKIILGENKKVIQHLEGGVIEEILIKEGQPVIQGQVLIKLNQTSSRTNQSILKKQLLALKASKIRLTAERDEKENLNLSGLIENFDNDPEVLKILKGEDDLFLTHKKSFTEKVNILNQKIKQMNDEIIALQSQVDAVSKKISYSQNELKSLQKLYNEKIVSKSRYIESQKQLAELKGNQGEYLANISKVKQTIAETQIEIINLKTENQNQIVKDLQDVQTKIVDLEERVKAATDVLQRTAIIAPQSGIVNGLKFHTIGGVIPPNAEIMELVPQDDELIAEVKINPTDIDSVLNGLPAKIRLSAYRSKIVPPIDGVVINVSANSFEEPQNGSSYFLARIRIDNTEIKKIKDIRLYPGMPIEAYIISGSRTFFEYLFDPITTSVRKSIREE